MRGYVKTFFNNEKFNITTLYIFLLITYSNFITNITFGNHFLPNILIQQYPSYRTLSEGRWGQDFLIQIFGGAGNAALQALLGLAILTVNSIIISKFIFNAKHYVALAFFIAASPFYLEYFQFQIDAIPWAIADSLIVVATIILISSELPRNILISSLMYALAISVYQPKIALILTLANLAVITKLVDSNSTVKQLIWLMLRLFLAILIGTTLYLASFLLFASGDNYRTDVNSLHVMFVSALGSYKFIYELLRSPYPYLPNIIQFIPFLLFAVGIFQLILSQKVHYKKLFVLIVCILIAPPLIYAGSIINSHTTSTHTRFLLPYFLFLVLGMVQISNNRQYGKFCMILICFITFNSALQISNEGRFVAVKTIYESNFINRIASKLEDRMEPGKSESPILIVGRIPELRRQDYIRNLPESMIIDTWPESFASFRQVDFLNFYFGTQRYRYPTEAEYKAALVNLNGKPVFPHPGSIYIENGVTVVKLEEYSDTSQVTDRR